MNENEQSTLLIESSKEYTMQNFDIRFNINQKIESSTFYDCNFHNIVPPKEGEYDGIVEYENIVYEFTSCDFTLVEFKGNLINVVFRNCKFNSVEFTKLIFNGVIFDNCFIELSNMENCHAMIDFRVGAHYLSFEYNDEIGFLKTPSPDNLSMESTTLAFNNSTIIKCTFNVVTLEKSLFQNTIFSEVNMLRCNLSSSQFIKCVFIKTQILKGSNISGTIFEPIIVFDLRIFGKKIEHDRLTTFRRYKRYYNKKGIGYLNSLSELIGTIKKRNIPKYACTTYLQFIELLKSQQEDNYYHCYYYYKYYSRFLQKSKSKKAVNILALMTSGYGEKPIWGLLTSFIIVILNSLIYMDGIVWKGEVISYKMSFTLDGIIPTFDKLVDWARCLYFSMTTFTTVGYGDAQALGFLSRAASFIEMFVGVLLMATIAGTIFRKITR